MDDLYTNHQRRAVLARWNKMTPAEQRESVAKAGRGNKGKKQSPEHIAKRIAAMRRTKQLKAKTN